MKIPDIVKKITRKLAYEFKGQILSLDSETKHIFDKLLAEGSIFMPFKGALLSELVYPRDLRFYRDIDLLFPNMKELVRAENIFQEMGYSSNRPNIRGVSYKKKSKGSNFFSFDLHRSFSFPEHYQYPCFESLVNELWRKSSRCSIKGVDVRVMTPEHMLIISCINSFKDGFLSIIDFYDMLQINRKYPQLNMKIIEKKKLDYGCAITLPLNLIKIEDYDDSKNFPIYYNSACSVCKKGLCKLKHRSQHPLTTFSGRTLKKINDLKYLPYATKQYGIFYGFRCITQQIISSALYTLEYLLKIGKNGTSYPGLREILWK
jgi:hypothetical protein